MKKATLWILIALLAVPGGWYYFIGRSLAARTASLEKATIAVDTRIVHYANVLRNVEESMDEYRRLNAIFAGRQVSFSGKDEVVGLYHALDSLCRQPGYDGAEITPSLEQVIRFLREWAQADSAVSIPISIRVNGSYNDLATLVEAVEQSRHFDHLALCRVNGSKQLYPRCGLDLTYFAKLDNRMELFDRE